MFGQRLQSRLLAVTLAGATLFAALAGLLAYRAGYARAIDLGRTQIDSLLTAVAKTAAIGAYAGDKVLLQEVADGLVRSHLVTRVRIVGPSGSTLMLREDSAPNLPPGALTVEHALVSPFDTRDIVAHMRAEANMAQLERSAREQAALLSALMVAQTLLVAWLIYAAASRIVSRPIVQLAGQLTRVRPDGHEHVQAPGGHHSDEIGALADSANALLDQTRDALSRERELRRRVEEVQAQVQRLVDSSSAGLFVTDRQGRLVQANPTGCRLIGLPDDAPMSSPGPELGQLAFASPSAWQALLARAESTDDTAMADLELRAGGPPARWAHVLVSLQEDRFEGVLYDITERRQAEHMAKHLAEHDPLTGLKSRAAIERLIDARLAEAAQAGTAVALYYIDLDGFKTINDRLGHDTGDAVLIECARRLRNAARRQGDVVGRLGGDEFVVALPHRPDQHDAVQAMGQELVHALRQPVTVGTGDPIRLSASVGLACWPEHGAHRSDLLRAADAAMYRAKRAGKDGMAIAGSA